MKQLKSQIRNKFAPLMLALSFGGVPGFAQAAPKGPPQAAQFPSPPLVQYPANCGVRFKAYQKFIDTFTEQTLALGQLADMLQREDLNFWQKQKRYLDFCLQTLGLDRSDLKTAVPALSQPILDGNKPFITASLHQDLTIEVRQRHALLELLNNNPEFDSYGMLQTKARLKEVFRTALGLKESQLTEFLVDHQFQVAYCYLHYLIERRKGAFQALARSYAVEMEAHHPAREFIVQLNTELMMQELQLRGQAMIVSLKSLIPALEPLVPEAFLVKSNYWKLEVTEDGLVDVSFRRLDETGREFVESVNLALKASEWRQDHFDQLPVLLQESVMTKRNYLAEYVNDLVARVDQFQIRKIESPKPLSKEGKVSLYDLTQNVLFQMAIGCNVLHFARQLEETQCKLLDFAAEINQVNRKLEELGLQDTEEGELAGGEQG